MSGVSARMFRGCYTKTDIVEIQLKDVSVKETIALARVTKNLSSYIPSSGKETVGILYIGACANLGLHQDDDESSWTCRHSGVPTVMLVSTSLIYVVLLVTPSILWLVVSLRAPASSVVVYRWVVIAGALSRCRAGALSRLAFAYNFYVYVITGRQFRSDLRAVFCRSSTVAQPAVVLHRRNDERIMAVWRQ